MFSGYFFNGFRRAMVQLPYVGIPFAAGYFIYSWGNKAVSYTHLTLPTTPYV